MVEYVIGPIAYLLLGLTAAFVFLMPSAYALIFAMLVGIEHLRSRRNPASNERPEPPFTVRRFDVYDLIPKLVPGYLLIAVLIILGLLTLGAQVFFVAELLLLIATLYCASWWSRLRRDGIPHAEVYVLTPWLFTRLAWLLWFTLDSGGETTRLFHRPFGGHMDWSSLSESLLEDTWLSIGALLLAIAAIIAAWILLRFKRPILHPALVLALTMPALGLFWAATPMGYVHVAATMPIVGYAISREVRRIEATPKHTQSRPFGKKTQGAVIAVVSVAAALGVYSAISVSAPGGTTLIPRGIEYILPQVIGIGLIALILLVIAAAVGSSHRFGAMLLGLVWLLIMAFTFNAPNLETWSPIFGYREYIATTIAGAVLLATMWRVFGPGALEAKPARNEIQQHEA